MSHLLRAIIVILAASAAAFGSDAPRALPAGQLPKDERLGDLANLDGYHPFRPVDSVEAWKQRAAALRRQVLVAEGLWPMPEKTPLSAVVHGRVQRDEYTVDRVILESSPGHYVTGSLYLPVGRTGKRPAVLCPHGHWPGGRYYDSGPDKVRGDIAIGAERFEVSGRYPLQARCVQLARMGCVVFMYDMEGYADSVQFEHRAGVRESMSGMKDWGFFSPQAELRSQTMMGLQTWNQVRALDFVASLPDVDTSRMAVTGASGGGTQTLILTAIDDRIAADFPAVMPSTSMQGGCTCENVSYLRIGAGNIDIAALAAPRPLFMSGAHDWTIELETKGLPDLQKLYAMLGVKGNVGAKVNDHFPHNYNAVSRVLMYNHFNKALKLGYPEPVIESDFSPLSKEETSVWDDKKHPAPAGDQVGDAHEKKLIAFMTAQMDKQMAALTPKDSSSLEEYRRIVGGGWDVILAGRTLKDIGEIDYDMANKEQRGETLMITATLTVASTGQQLPTLFLHPKEKSRWNGEVVIWVDAAGKNGMLDGRGTPNPRVTDLLNAGYSVASLDLIGTGEFTSTGDPVTEQRRVSYAAKKGDEPAWRKAACYTYGYNSPLFTQRVHDVMTMVKFVASDKHQAKKVHLVGLDPASGAIAAAARSRCEDLVDQTIIDGSFRFASLNEMTHPMFAPGAVKFGDVPALIALCAPHAVTVIGEPDSVTRAVYAASGNAKALGTATEREPLKTLAR